MEDDHDELIIELKLPSGHDPGEDAIGSAREFLNGYEFRLEQAERTRHFPGAKREDYARALAWADDPKRDRQGEALPILLQRIRHHPRPPYSPEVLLREYELLQSIPLPERVSQRYVERMTAWLDRVEIFLALGQEGKRASKGQWRRSRYEKLAQALSLLDKHPDWTNRRIAQEVAVHPGTLSKWPEFRRAVEAIAEQGKRRLPRGWRTANGFDALAEPQDE